MLESNTGGVGGAPLSPMGTNQTGNGGQANPPYLQHRKRLPRPVNGSTTAPVMTPGNYAAPGENSAQMTSSPGLKLNPQPVQPQAPLTQAGGAAPTPPQAGGNDLAGTYDFFKSDLANQAKQAKSNAVADASARGVYYGTPLTGSEADIDTQYQRGLGQLQAGMYGNLQQDQLTRLGLATNLLGSNPSMPAGGIDPNMFSSLGQLFGTSAISAPRKSPLSNRNNDDS